MRLERREFLSRPIELAELEKTLLELEAKHGITTSTLVEEIESGRLQETLEFCDWLLLAKRIDRLKKRGENKWNNI